MAVSFAFFCFFLAVMGHELGHMIAMRDAGITIKCFGIGLPVRPQMLIGIPLLQRIFGPNFEIGISPWLIGAYVSADARETSLKNSVYVFGAGPIANIVQLFLFSAIFALIILPGNEAGEMKYFFGIVIQGTGHEVALWFTAAAITTWVLRKWIALWLLLPLGLGVLGYTIFALSGQSLATATQSSGGIVLVSEMASKTGSLRDAVWFGMIINFVLAFTNLLPLGPLDGGRILQVITRRFAPSAVEAVGRIGSIAFAALIVFCLYSDGLRVIGYFQ